MSLKAALTPTTFWAQSSAPAILVACAAYLPLVGWGQRAMAGREPFELRRHFVVWNFTLSFLSFLALAVIVVCDPGSLASRRYAIADMHGLTVLCNLLFCLTKIVEFGDTAFLVLRKKPVIFLHTYHHVTVTLFCLSTACVGCESSHLFAAVNLFVHGVMYGYYGLAVICRNSPLLRVVRPWITRLQLAQMVLGMTLAMLTIRDESTPSAHVANAYAGVTMYISYTYLFGDFYIRNYLPRYNSIRLLWVSTLAAAVFAAVVSTVFAANPAAIGWTFALAAAGVLTHLMYPSRLIGWWNPLLAESDGARDFSKRAETTHFAVARLVCAPLATAIASRDLRVTSLVWGVRTVAEAAVVTWLNARRERKTSKKQ